MTRNDTFFKILFAIEIALVPLTMAAYLMFPVWSVAIFLAGILVSKIWLELFKNKSSRSHKIILAIGNIITIVALVVFFTVYGHINLVLGIVVASFAAVVNLLRLTTINDVMPEMVDAVDSCYMLFECLTIASFAVLFLYELVANIALFALLLTAVVSAGYRVYYHVRYKGLLDKVKNLFRRK